MGLTTEQLALINNLTYTAGIKPIPSIYEYEGMTVRDYINDYLAVADQVAAGKEYSTFMDGKEWKQVLDAVSRDDELCSMTIASTYNDTSMDDRGLVLTDPGGGEAVVAYRGTGSKEWPDNFQGGGPTGAADGVSTPQQEKALAWYQQQYQELDLGKYDQVTVTGHSKGGNKAQYIAIEDSTVDRCVSFDGQGFSDDYVTKKEALIAAHQGKITNHSAEGDYVNILLNSVGTQKYYTANQENVHNGNFLENHSPNTYLHYDEKGNVVMVEGKQMKEVQDIDAFLNSYLRTLSPEERAEALKVVGELVEKGMNHEFDGLSLQDIVNNYLNDERYRNKLTSLLGYLIKYEEEKPGIIDSVKKILTGMGMGDCNSVIDIIVLLGTNDILRNLIEFEHDALGNSFLKWAIGGKLEEYGFTSDKDKEVILHLLYLVYSSRDKVEKIENGSDIQIHSTAGNESDNSYSTGSSGGSGRAEFEISIQQLRAADDMLENVEKGLLWAIERMKNVCSQLNGSLWNIRFGLDKQCTILEQEKDKVDSLKYTLRDIINEYTSTEDRLRSAG